MTASTTTDLAVYGEPLALDLLSTTIMNSGESDVPAVVHMIPVHNIIQSSL